MSYHGIVRGGVVVLDQGLPLTDGTEVVVTPIGAFPGSPAEILADLEEAPKVPPEWVDELERLIAEGQKSGSP